MGLNATTFVPAYTSGEVLTAADLTVTNSGAPVFADAAARDAAFGGAGEKVLAEGQLAYLEDSNVVQYYDGSVWATVGPTAPPASGLVVVQAETAFSAVANVTADGIFTSAYTNYRLAMRFQSSGGSIAVQFRAATVDTATNYNFQSLIANSATVSSARTTSQTSGTITGDSGGAFWSLVIVDISGPQLAEPTVYAATGTRNNGGYNVPVTQQMFGNQSDSTVFDGIKILTTVGTFTGNYTIYGYSKTV